MACRFPSAPTLEAFWQLLITGREGIVQLPEQTLAEWGVPPQRRRAENFVPAAPFLDGYDRFDASFFGYAPDDAALSSSTPKD